jgi:hypothetical protein
MTKPMAKKNEVVDPEIIIINKENMPTTRSMYNAEP